MAERLQSQLMVEAENVSFVVGPDAYRKMPEILRQVREGMKAAETELSTVETYADIEPVRMNSNGISAYISIMRGCQNYCAYCVVPYTRGRERSRDPETIVNEARNLFAKGYKEVTLLGQNVNSYKWKSDAEEVGFPELMERVAQVSPQLRVRFSTSHPKGLSDRLLEVMAKYDNICKCIHLPVQSGSDRMLKLMNRHYDSAWYLDRIAAIRRYMPDCSITTDVIAGFCTETEEDHQATLQMFRTVRYDYAYMFKFSMRPNTYAEKHLVDDIPEAEKTRRLEEIIHVQEQQDVRQPAPQLRRALPQALIRHAVDGVAPRVEMRLPLVQVDEVAEGVRPVGADVLVGVFGPLHLQHPHLHIQLFENGDGGVSLAPVKHNDHSNAHIEDVEHLAVGD